MRYSLKWPNGLPGASRQPRATWVEVELSDGSSHTANVFDIEQLVQMCNAGGIETPFVLTDQIYYFRRDMIFVNGLTEARMHRIVEDLIETGDFRRAFIPMPRCLDDLIPQQGWQLN